MSQGGREFAPCESAFQADKENPAVGERWGTLTAGLTWSLMKASTFSHLCRSLANHVRENGQYVAWALSRWNRWRIRDLGPEGVFRHVPQGSNLHAAGDGFAL